MNGLLDLCLTVTPPSVDAPPEIIASFELRCDAFGLTPAAGLLRDPLTPQERAELEWYLEHYWQWPYEEFARRGRRVEELLVEAGKKLYSDVLGNRETMSIVQLWRLQPNVQRQISIISDEPAALSLPWELLHDDQGFLALRTQNPVSILRRLPQFEPASLLATFAPPLRVLLVTARPEGAGFVDPRGIARELLDEVQSQIEAGSIALEFLRPPTLKTLRKRLSENPPVHILHFDGHGSFEAEPDPDDRLRMSGGGQGKLAFEKDDGKLDLVPAERLAQVLQDSSVRLGVLTACQSAKGAADDLFSSVAARLIKGGVDAVAAMSASVLVASAARYVEAFYRKIAEGKPVTEAHERARQALHDDPHRHLHRRRRDEAASPVELQDWWLPHFYQQRPLTLVVRDDGSPRVSEERAGEQEQAEDLSYALPPAPRYDFHGRARELHQIERWLMGGRVVVIHGFGGVGKTALARESADWLARTGLYAQSCFVSFEHGGDAATLLAALGHRLGVYDGSYDPSDARAALKKLRGAVKKKATLVIADNLESILPGGEAQLDAAARAQLWDVLLQLAKMRCGVMLTSRDANFGDGRMSHGPKVKHLELRGLHAEDAYALAVRLLKDLEIDQARAPYPELRDLLVQLDHHPLAIQLVLTALRDESLTLSRISTDFASLLPKFTDDAETGRNRSLLASLEYSLRRLTDEQRVLLVRLAPFEGGASEDDLLAITEIPESAWATLRPALEQAALIAPEHVGFTAPFLRFHPVLSPFLRSEPGADIAALQSRFAARYHSVANYLYNEDNRNPLPVRELVRRELPNMRRALELLLKMGVLDEAADLESSIARFLTYFGLEHERDEMRRRVAEAVTVLGERAGGALTQIEYLREIGLGEDEFNRGNLRAAYARFSRLLERIVVQPTGAPLSQGSYEHCLTLIMVTRCLQIGGQPGAAEERLREALALNNALIAAQPENQIFIRQCGALLTGLGDALRHQGKYAEARVAYEAGLDVDKQLEDARGQGVTLLQLGTLALVQHDYVEARRQYLDALALFHALGEPAMEAVAWHQLGMVAEEQKQWTEAENCYRESLAIKEQQGNAVGATSTCNQLAIVAANAGRPEEAAGWFKRALSVPDLPDSDMALYSNNLAKLLKDEAQTGRIPKERLVEARGYAERALAIKETLEASLEIWTTLMILADIAEMEGQAEAARNYRRRERETFAAFAGNRYHIDKQFGPLIVGIAASLGDEQARAAVEAALPQLEAAGWRIASAVHRIWAGERDWRALAEDMDTQDALLVLRVLETIAEQSGPTPAE
jgi:tetratricopeptide (TPR) repeat protein